MCTHLPDDIVRVGWITQTNQVARRVQSISIFVWNGSLCLRMKSRISIRCDAKAECEDRHVDSEAKDWIENECTEGCVNYCEMEWQRVSHHRFEWPRDGGRAQAWNRSTDKCATESTEIAEFEIQRFELTAQSCTEEKTLIITSFIRRQTGDRRIEIVGARAENEFQIDDGRFAGGGHRRCLQYTIR